MIVHVLKPSLLVELNPVNGRISGLRKAKGMSRDVATARGLSVKPNSTGFDGDYLLIDYATLVGLENRMRSDEPRLKHSTIRKRLMAVLVGPFVGDMFRIKDAAEQGELGVPLQGELEWLARECAESARLGPVQVAIERGALSNR